MAITDKLSAIADAIRAKTGESGTMKLEQMPEKIAGISTGITPSGNINITDTQQTDVTNYATAQVVDANLTAENIADGVTVLGIVGTHQGGGGELPQLHAPTISIVEDTLTITNPDTNGDFVTAFGGYANGVSVGAIPVSSNPLDLTSLGFPAGDYTLTATCKGTNFAESEQSNSLAYTNIFYNVSSVLVGCSSNNSAATVRRGKPYTATISALAGYKLLGATVTVTMGGEDITSTAYTYSNKQGLISIESASGEIAISVTAVVDAVPFTVRYDSYSTPLGANLAILGTDLYTSRKNTSGSYRAQILKSANNGASWVLGKSLSGMSTSYMPESVFSNGNMMYCGNYTSTDGTTWTSGSTFGKPNWTANDVFIRFNSPNDSYYFSKDLNSAGSALSYTKFGIGDSYKNSTDYVYFKYVNGLYFCINKSEENDSYYRKIMYSSDLSDNLPGTWTNTGFYKAGGYLKNLSSKVVDLTYDGNSYYGLTNDGKIVKCSSLSAVDVKIADLDSALTWKKIECNGENFIAIPTTGKKYAVSSDGVSWTYGDLDYDEALNDLKVVDGKFVLLGATKIYTSE